MKFKIDCLCGEVLLADSVQAGNTVTCPQCNWVHSMPLLSDSAQALVMEGTGDRTTWTLPVIGSTVSTTLLMAALIWALLGGEIGRGLGANGGGMGPLATGDGSGIEQSGDGGGAGSEGVGTGGDPGEPIPEDKQSAPPRATAPSPGDDIEIGFGPMKDPEPRQPESPQPEPPHSPSGDLPGRSGNAGAGAGGRGTGEDPGARGDVSFTLVWKYDVNVQGRDRRGGPDVDIWILDPLGGRISTSTDVLERTPEGGKADFDDRGAHGNGDGGGPERVFWPDGKAPAGKYIYGVRWYQGVGSARFTLRVYQGDKLVDTKTGLLRSTDKGKNIKIGDIINGSG
ncbi:MAG: hypothetical protein HN350_17395 [Phycisphaerales bacterium]|jgi:hypothetical protein|nr:hypothetical protein [Phycisphaerales bacterium]